MLDNATIERNRHEYLSLLGEVKRPGIDKIISYINGASSDFFIAPNSANYQGNFSGALCANALKIYEIMDSMNSMFPNLKQSQAHNGFIHVGRQNEHVKKIPYPKESIIVVSLLSHLYDINIYYPSEKRTRTKSGEWKSYMGYEFNDKSLPYGMGELSVEIIRSFMNLSEDEMLAIRWSGAIFDPSMCVPSRTRTCYFDAMSRCPLLTMLSSATLIASNDLKIIDHTL